MSDRTASGILEPGSDAHTSFLIEDAVQTVLRDIDLDSVSEADSQIFSTMLGDDKVAPNFLERAALRTGITLSTGLMKSALVDCMVAWSVGGKETIVAWETLPDFTAHATDRTLLTAVHGVLRSLALFESGADPSSVCIACLGLADALNSAGQFEDAVAAACTATNFANSANLELGAYEAVFTSAGRAGLVEATSFAMAGRAKAMSQLSGEKDKVRGFDAIAAALRCLPQEQANRRNALILLSQAASARHLNLWKRILAAIAQRDGNRQGDELDGLIDLLTSPTADVSEFSQIALLCSYLETSRQDLRVNHVGSALVTSWITGTFEHFAYRDAIPHFSSMLREKEASTIVLLIGHELSHVLSMQGHIGIALTALRAAAVELELPLWSFSEVEPDLTRDLIAPLRTTELIALAQAEQSLAVARKRQILQATWSPWFEGIATFAELGVDPSINDTFSDIGRVLLNCVDAVPEKTDIVDLHEWYEGQLRQSERLFSDAQQSDGPSRLKGYLDRHHKKYLPGYVAVRSVVSTWRRTVGSTLSGADAYRVLLHRTRFDTRSAIPDLSLPVAEFAREAERMMLRWVQETASIEASEIGAFLSHHARAMWRDGALICDYSDEELAREVDEANGWYDECVLAAMSTHVGPTSAVTNRIPDADEAMRAVLAAVAEGLSAKQPRARLSAEVGYAIQQQRKILVLGQVTCPFWLDSEHKRIVCAVRTTECKRDGETPSFDLFASPLGDTAYADIEAEVEKLRLGRISVYRVIDLIPTEVVDGREFGSQVVAFSYGEWLHVKNRGVRMGLAKVPDSLVEDIRAYVHRPGLLAAEYSLASFEPAARRVITWLESRPLWSIGDVDCDFPTYAWAQHVQKLADSVLDAAEHDAPLERDVSRKILEAALGTGNLTEGIVASGLRALDDADPLRRAQITNTLFRSAFQPSQEDWLDDDAGSAGFLLSRSAGLWDVTPFGSNIEKGDRDGDKRGH